MVGQPLAWRMADFNRVTQKSRKKYEGSNESDWMIYFGGGEGAWNFLYMIDMIDDEGAWGLASVVHLCRTHEPW